MSPLLSFSPSPIQFLSTLCCTFQIAVAPYSVASSSHWCCAAPLYHYHSPQLVVHPKLTAGSFLA
ncbi:hypothetical protein B0H19DRAFT_1133526, partial [Mycena capillaripes]